MSSNLSSSQLASPSNPNQLSTSQLNNQMNSQKNSQLNQSLGSSMTPNLNHSDNLFVANLQSVSLEKLVKSKLEVLFQQQREAQVELNGLYNIVIEQVEKPLIELALASHNGNQVRTAQMLGINRNTLKKKIDNYKIRVRKSN
jgi:Fis family transcriptional regulator